MNIKCLIVGHQKTRKQCPGGRLIYCSECKKVLNVDLDIAIDSSDKEWLFKGTQ